MILDNLYNLMNLAVEITNSDEWSNKLLQGQEIEMESIFEVDIESIFEGLKIEIQSNLIGQNLIYKEDVIRTYITSISKINAEILELDYANEFKKPHFEIALNNIKKLYQDVVDSICMTCVLESIDLKKIVNANHYTYSNIDISIYNDEVGNSKLNQIKMVKTAQTSLKEYFDENEHFLFFEYLLNNFSTKFSDFNKVSCIYRLMIEDKLMNKELRPERLKNLLYKQPYNLEKIEYSLKQKVDLSDIIVKHYYTLKDEFLSKK